MPEAVGYNRSRPTAKEADLGCEMCGASEEERRTQKCPICFKRFCEECAVSVSGRTFCSRFCGEYFFFGCEDDI